MKLAGYPLVHIQWVDSTSTSGWGTGVELNANMTVETVGLLLHEARDRVVVAAHIGYHNDGPHSFHSQMTIPRVAITKMRRLP